MAYDQFRPRLLVRHNLLSCFSRAPLFLRTAAPLVPCFRRARRLRRLALSASEPKENLPPARGPAGSSFSVAPLACSSTSSIQLVEADTHYYPRTATHATYIFDTFFIVKGGDLEQKGRKRESQKRNEERSKKEGKKDKKEAQDVEMRATGLVGPGEPRHLVCSAADAADACDACCWSVLISFCIFYQLPRSYSLLPLL